MKTFDDTSNQKIYRSKSEALYDGFCVICGINAVTPPHLICEDCLQESISQKSMPNECKNILPESHNCKTRKMRLTRIVKGLYKRLKFNHVKRCRSK